MEFTGSPISRHRSARTSCSSICGRKTDGKFPTASTAITRPSVFHELSDLMPSKLHMTVPTDFRRSSAIPEVLVLHRAHLESSDVQEIHGVRVTRSLRTIVDLLRSGNVDPSQLKLAVDEALRRGLIARREIDRLPHDKLQRSLQELTGHPA